VTAQTPVPDATLHEIAAADAIEMAKIARGRSFILDSKILEAGDSAQAHCQMRQPGFGPIGATAVFELHFWSDLLVDGMPSYAGDGRLRQRDGVTELGSAGGDSMDVYQAALPVRVTSATFECPSLELMSSSLLCTPCTPSARAIQ
jgi:hypothetical protein